MSILREGETPGGDLVECLSQNQELASIPTIVVSGHAGPAERKQLTDLGVAAVLNKPVGLEDLLVELRSFIQV